MLLAHEVPQIHLQHAPSEAVGPQRGTCVPVPLEQRNRIETGGLQAHGQPAGSGTDFQRCVTYGCQAPSLLSVIGLVIVSFRHVVPVSGTSR